MGRPKARRLLKEAVKRATEGDSDSADFFRAMSRDYAVLASAETATLPRLPPCEAAIDPYSPFCDDDAVSARKDLADRWTDMMQRIREQHPTDRLPDGDSEAQRMRNANLACRYMAHYTAQQSQLVGEQAPIAAQEAATEDEEAQAAFAAFLGALMGAALAPRYPVQNNYFYGR